MNNLTFVLILRVDCGLTHHIKHGRTSLELNIVFVFSASFSYTLSFGTHISTAWAYIFIGTAPPYPLPVQSTGGYSLVHLY